MERIERENDLLKQQKEDIFTSLKMMSCDSRLGVAHASRLVELVRKVSPPCHARIFVATIADVLQHEVLPVPVAIRPLTNATLPTNKTQAPHTHDRTGDRSEILSSGRGPTSRLLADAHEGTNLVRVEQQRSNEPFIQSLDGRSNSHFGVSGDAREHISAPSIGGTNNHHDVFNNSPETVQRKERGFHGIIYLQTSCLECTAPTTRPAARLDASLDCITKDSDRISAPSSSVKAKDLDTLPNGSVIPIGIAAPALVVPTLPAFVSLADICPRSLHKAPVRAGQTDPQ